MAAENFKQSFVLQQRCDSLYDRKEISGVASLCRENLKNRSFSEAGEFALLAPLFFPDRHKEARSMLNDLAGRTPDGLNLISVFSAGTNIVHDYVGIDGGTN